MSSDNHKILDGMIAGHNAAPVVEGRPENRDELYRMAQVEFSTASPEVRAGLIAQLEEQIERDADNTDDNGRFKQPGGLRQRAQLLSLKRSLEDSHHLLKKAGR